MCLVLAYGVSDLKCMNREMRCIEMSKASYKALVYFLGDKLVLRGGKRVSLVSAYGICSS